MIQKLSILISIFTLNLDNTLSIHSRVTMKLLIYAHKSNFLNFIRFRSDMIGLRNLIELNYRKIPLKSIRRLKRGKHKLIIFFA